MSESTIRLLHDLTAKAIGDRIATGRQLLERLPATSIPFRPSTLEAARPGYTVRRDDISAVPHGDRRPPARRRGDPAALPRETLARSCPGRVRC